MPRYLLLLALALLTGCSAHKRDKHSPKREFRGAWVATVVNIDWPKDGNDSAAKQKADFLDILDFYQELNYNALIVQVRAAGDAFYPTDLAPWSRYLTGKEGRAPAWEEDPLAWMVQKTHERGMEFHAWFNPYRATFDLKTETLSPNHDYFMHPEWMVRYGNKYYYNPGIPAVRKKFNQIIAEVVAKYNIDAVHFDDYFYPYKIQGETLRDSVDFNHYAVQGQSLEDWRRSNVDSLVKGVHQTIKDTKPWVQFGISPFGVWKNKSTDPRGSDTQAGQTNYDDLYADPLLWMEQGWLDYIAPQAYWSMDLPVASHRTILKWWANHSPNTNIYMGNGAYKVRNNADGAWSKKKELPNQIALARETPQVGGNILFSAKSLMNHNPDVVAYLKRKFYKYPALTPSMPVAADLPLTTPKVVRAIREKDSVSLLLDGAKGLTTALFYRSGKKGRKTNSIRKLVHRAKIESNRVCIPVEAWRGRSMAVGFLDRYGREVPPLVLTTKQLTNNDKKR
ncbi:glycoside hydrolase family 10 protein [Maribacter sp. 2307ULW6-5]|uniref:glycoside hydrolase family 10 protein n=1 Tax=Maribacter sp. 2307ULW6-5 TaxID=3386275 RepID=UPI0039BC4413